ncbi:GNAT family N-acetyltransferase [Pedobacter sp. PAMC26386]|nr:GNAT family N-acetyltransferase [Pedobacter sp. PAMC26386]
MEILAETERLILRELLLTDKHGMYELDTDPLVHQYIYNQQIDSLDQAEEMIRFIRQQYAENGTGRLAIVNKDTNEFMGWAGLKLVRGTYNNYSNYYEVGYRLIHKYWGKGYATEAAHASLDYGFTGLKIDKIYAMAAIENEASKNVLEKIGMRYIETFDLDGEEHNWFEITVKEWKKRKL